MTDNVAQNVKAFFMPILMTVCGFLISSGVFMGVNRIEKMSDAINSIDHKLGVLGEKYSNIEKSLDSWEYRIKKAEMDWQQCNARIYTLESQLQWLRESEKRKE